ncbi:MAG TPA: hypothetical protein PLX89_23320 [Verrucomicrobiota bacterium]|nr:hypothetical protein [Verrucomicrobiales bacterium]HRI15940.1 hypothetical protein [Verrucomicrobiota bacterium]
MGTGQRIQNVSRSIPLGRIVATRNALAQVSHADIVHALHRHQHRDWGDLCRSDRAANDRALVDGTRILSAYETESGVKFWIITEADRSFTTVLLPADY